MPCIAIDLTPLRPGGENGGAKLLVQQLLTEFQQLDHPFTFLLLTASWNHQELAAFDGPRFERLCVLPEITVSPAEPAPPKLAEKSLPHTSPRWLRRHNVSLLFCPFTAPTYAESNIPVVSIVYDLQHLAYPQFFTSPEITERDAILEQLRRQVDTIICISEFTRQALLTQLEIPSERTQTVHVCIHSRLKKNTSSADTLAALQIDTRPYLFYPANFWPHKNHRMLLAAYNILIRRNPNLELDLVFTGDLAQPEGELRFAVQAMGLESRVHFLGYLPDEQLAAVFQGCQFMIFPSLYEGFGIPLLEAFTFGKPVLCSNVTSLPEIGGEAALYFDPRNPSEIVQTIEGLLAQTELAQELIRRGYQRLAQFHRQAMSGRYLEIFAQTLQRKPNFVDELVGVFDDGWLEQEVEISYSSHPQARILEFALTAPEWIPRRYPAVRTLELVLTAPEWIPHREITIQTTDGSSAEEQHVLARGQTASFKFPLTPEAGYLALDVSPVFKPGEITGSNDERWLSCMCQSCRILYPDGSAKTLFKQSQDGKNHPMSLTLSVITPSFNQGCFIERTIQSVLGQEIPGLEYLVCDGGSTDETVDILRRYEDRLRWVSEPDKGQTDAVNKGILNTSGEIIGWLNSDDIYYPGVLAAVLTFFEQNPAVDVVYGDANHIDEHDAVIEAYYTEDWNYERLKDVCYLCQPAVFFRRRVIEKKGLLDVTLHYTMDYEYWLRLGADIQFVRLNRLLAGSRLYQNNKTLGNRVAVHREMIEMTHRSLGQAPQRWIFNYAHAIADTKGYNRQNPGGRVKYISLIVVMSTLFFLRWYHYLPRSAMQTMWEWTTGPLYQSLREWLRGKFHN